jgi:hypothetical protein
LVAAVIYAAAVAPIHAEIPHRINYQGKLTDSSTGEALAGSHNVTFRIYDDPDAGSLLWSEPLTISADAEGIFSAVLGSITPITGGLDGPVWLEVEVGGEVLSPRREIVSVPYALRAEAAAHSMNADSLGARHSNSYALSDHDHDEAYVNEGQESSITSAMIVDGQGSSLDADMVDGLHAEAFAGSAHAHDGRYYLQTDLDTPGTLNQSENPVEWSRLKGVPEDFADGTDDLGGAGDGHSLDAADGSPADVVYVADNGKVGIGITNPTLAKLFVIDPTGEAIYGSSNDGAGVVGFSQNYNGILGISNNGKAGSFVGEVYVSGRVDTDSAFSISGETLIRVPGDRNLIIGRHTGTPEYNDYLNMCVGDSTGFVETGQHNTFLGYNAGHGSPPYATASPEKITLVNEDNVFVGYYAGYSNHAWKNVFIGSEAGRAITSGTSNTLLGYRAAFMATTGGNNVCVGMGSGQQLDDGNNNVYCGVWAGSSRPEGSHNTYIGFDAGGTHMGGMGEAGDYNTAIGSWAGLETDGSRNVFLGSYAGRGYQGSDKLIIANGENETDVLVFGDFSSGNLGLGTMDPERRLHLKGENPRLLIEAAAGNPEINLKESGDASTDVWAIYKESVTGDLRFYQNGDRIAVEAGTGNVGIGTTTPGTCKLYVNGGAGGTSVWGACSDLRLKKNIEEISDALSKVLSLRGISFDWREDEYPGKRFAAGRHYGVIAQEVEKVLPEVVTETADGQKSVLYSELIPVLIESIKSQQEQIEMLRARVEELEE